MSRYPTYEDHQRAWEELASGIASLRPDIAEVEEGSIPPNSKKGSLTIIGSGIETIGFALGDKRLIEDADKVLFCVADPATIVWLKQLRPDALDLYVLYGDNKVRYTTYMQMTEAQLYWVRKGFNVVVVFYGHPGIFVLSTHRAIKIGRREGYRAVMKAGVCALDTLCADLGVDPCHPGMQTHEATDCLVRQRHLDPSLHVVLWQVGLIGELGYRRQGYLNANFSYFISWLQTIYGEHYEITHYIGSRYPTIDPLVETYTLSSLHDPDIQTRITGLSTFYIPPRDVIPSDYQVALDLGILTEGQQIIHPKSPLREIGLYGAREMKAFNAFAEFRIPPSCKWQDETAASRFLIELRFDTALQKLYETNPLAAINDERFSDLSDRERALLISRDSGSIQIASKGNHLRSPSTEKAIIEMLHRKADAVRLFKSIGELKGETARQKLSNWLQQNDLTVEWPALHRSIDYVNQNNLFPWTGIYLESSQELLVTLLGHNTERTKSILYINGQRIKNYSYNGGIIRWRSDSRQAYNGFIRPDADAKGNRRLVGKIWLDGEAVPAVNNFVAAEVDPDRKSMSHLGTVFSREHELKSLYGIYAVRTNGRLAKQVNRFQISDSGMHINDHQVSSFTYDRGTLRWNGGNNECYAGEVTLLIDPIIGSIELYGHSKSKEEQLKVKCYGAAICNEEAEYQGPRLPIWAQRHLSAIVQQNSINGGLLLWHKWEKYHFTSRFVNKVIAALA